MLGAVVLVLVCAAAPVAVPAVWQARADHVRNEQSVAVLNYPSVEFMADHIGCTTTLRPVASRGGSTDAGTCTIAHPAGAGTVRIDMRIFDTGEAAAQSVAWLESVWGANPPVGAAGGNWALTVTGTRDPAVLDRIVTALPDGTESYATH